MLEAGDDRQRVSVAEPAGSWQRAADGTWEAIRRVHLGSRRPANWVELFKFGVVGGLGYIVNLTVFALLTQALELNHVIAAVGAFCIAVSNNFLWNRTWTFRAAASGGHAGFQAARFFAVSLVGLAVNLVVLAVLVDGFGAAELPSQAAAVAVAMPANFVGNKLWTFSQV
ncbi:MAG: GtrA family protein [Longimicrobiaceae bacterium]